MDDLLDLLKMGPDPSIIVFVYLGDILMLECLCRKNPRPQKCGEACAVLCGRNTSWDLTP